MSPSVGFEIRLHWSQEDEAYIAEVPTLPGCMADGPTPGLAIAAVALALSQWLETAVSLGRQIPQPRADSPLPSAPEPPDQRRFELLSAAREYRAAVADYMDDLDLERDGCDGASPEQRERLSIASAALNFAIDESGRLNEERPT